jgi:hypothetical protein
MKKIILIVVFIFLAGINIMVAQKGRTQPIPSFDYKLHKDVTEFVESKKSFNPPVNPKEKREMEIVISSSSTSPFDVFATIWLVKKRTNIVKGPYTIYLDQQFSKTIDNGEWGVVMSCDFEHIKTSVWID